MTAIDYNKKLNSLINEAAESQIPLGQIVSCLEIAKIGLVTDHIAMRNQMRAMDMAAQMAENGTPKIEPFIKPATN